MMAEICHDWNTLDDKKEIEIIEKYACFINKCTISFTGKERKHLHLHLRVPLSLIILDYQDFSSLIEFEINVCF